MHQYVILQCGLGNYAYAEQNCHLSLSITYVSK